MRAQLRNRLYKVLDGSRSVGGVVEEEDGEVLEAEEVGEDAEVDICVSERGRVMRAQYVSSNTKLPSPPHNKWREKESVCVYVCVSDWLLQYDDQQALRVRERGVCLT